MGVWNGEPIKGTLLCDSLVRLIFGNSVEGGVIGDPSLLEFVSCGDGGDVTEALEDVDWDIVEG